MSTLPDAAPAPMEDKQSPQAPVTTRSPDQDSLDHDVEVSQLTPSLSRVVPSPYRNARPGKERGAVSFMLRRTTELAASPSMGRSQSHLPVQRTSIIAARVDVKRVGSALGMKQQRDVQCTFGGAARPCSTWSRGELLRTSMSERRLTSCFEYGNALRTPAAPTCAPQKRHSACQCFDDRVLARGAGLTSVSINRAGRPSTGHRVGHERASEVRDGLSRWDS